MQYKRGVLAVFASLVLAVSSLTAFAEAKIGVSDAQRAILQSELGRQGMDQINSAFVEQEEQLKEMQKEITTLLEKLKKDTQVQTTQNF